VVVSEPLSTVESPPVGLLARAWLSEKPHPGVAAFARTLHQGIAFSKPLSASGLPTFVYDSGRRPRCSGKERDGESGLDFFGARYLSSAQGRFTSPDPLLNSGRPWEPQSWNRYAYTLNNPLRLVDPTGLYDLDNSCAADDRKCNKAFAKHAKDLKKAVTKLNNKLAKAKLGSDERERLTVAMSTLGTEGDHNGVLVQFGALEGTAAARTEAFDDHEGGVDMEITFDPAKNKGDMWAVNAAHEATHVSDETEPEYNAGELSPFSTEYRGYMTSSAAAHALGMGSLSMKKSDLTSHEIWNRSWLAADKTTLTSKGQTARDQGVTGQVQDKDHPVTTPHDPW
jgi:RHS repeat-associated protein